MFGPSDGAFFGFSCVSINNPEIEVVTAALANTSTNSDWPPDLLPFPPGAEQNVLHQK